MSLKLFFNYETQNSYDICIRTDDGHGGTFDEDFTVTVNNINAAPTDISLSQTDIDENVSGGTTVGTLSGTDDNAADDKLSDTEFKITYNLSKNFKTFARYNTTSVHGDDKDYLRLEAKYTF